MEITSGSVYIFDNHYVTSRKTADVSVKTVNSFWDRDVLAPRGKDANVKECKP
jgi:hypothetical protein